jgi:tetratricopeptide (TPR) repeat protein
LATVTRAGVVVTGSFVKSGDSLRFSATLVDARNNKPIQVIEQAAGPASDPLVAISALRERVLGSLARDATRGWSLADEAPKYEAYRAMMDGLKLSRRQDWREAVPFYRRAIQLDSDFVSPRLGLANAYANLGLPDSADRVIADVDRVRDKLSVMDKLRVDHLHAMLSGDFEAELRLGRQYIARDSAPTWVFQTGYMAMRLLRPKEAIGLLRASDSALIAAGSLPQITALSRAYHEAGEFGAELSTLERGRKLFPAVRPFAGAELSAYAGQRRSAAALALADTLIAAISDADFSPAAMVVAGAQEFGAHGDDVTAGLLAGKLTTWDAAHPGRRLRAREIGVGLAWLFLHQLDSAENHYRRAAQDSLTLQVAGLLAVVSARRGDTARARATADSLALQQSPRTAGLRDIWRAAILAELGEREQAMTLLRQSTHEGQSMDAWHNDERLRALRGYPPFTELITPKG